MEILVCVKQVPDTAEVKIDPVKHTVIRAGVPNIFNPFDQNALEAALALKDADKDVKSHFSRWVLIRQKTFFVKASQWALTMLIFCPTANSVVPIR